MDFKRYELKYYLNEIGSNLIKAQLSALMKEDRHGGPEGYLVRSLYFDSINDDCLYEKQSGILHRKKYRLRTYGTDNSSFRLEIKHKHGQFIHKESEFIRTTHARELILGNYSCLLTYGKPMLDRVYAEFVTRHYTPKVIVSYQRLAFTIPDLNVRITIDKDLRSHVTNTDLFNNAATMPIVIEGKQVLELKYDSFLPQYLTKVISSASLERMAISKYTLARRYHKQAKWEDN